MDHSLRTISYIADIGDIIVIMARRRMLSSPGDNELRKKRQAKIICHVFESEEVGLLFFVSARTMCKLYSKTDIVTTTKRTYIHTTMLSNAPPSRVQKIFLTSVVWAFHTLE